MLTAGINLIVGPAFLLAPEARVDTLARADLTGSRSVHRCDHHRERSRFLVPARQGTWEGARVLFTVALVYGVVVLVAVPIQMPLGESHDSIWIYVAVDGLFLGPILYVFWSYERSKPAAEREPPS
jgi:hypothetical protein